jgi:hypothetical protein
MLQEPLNRPPSGSHHACLYDHSLGVSAGTLRHRPASASASAAGRGEGLLSYKTFYLGQNSQAAVIASRPVSAGKFGLEEIIKVICKNIVRIFGLFGFRRHIFLI